MKPHPLFGTGPEWTVLEFPGYFDFTRDSDGLRFCIAKPYQAQPTGWWRAQFD